MTIEVGIVNLMLETRGGAGRQGGAIWYCLLSYLASILSRRVLLFCFVLNALLVSANFTRVYYYRKLYLRSARCGCN